MIGLYKHSTYRARHHVVLKGPATITQGLQRSLTRMGHSYICRLIGELNVIVASCKAPLQLQQNDTARKLARWEQMQRYLGQ